MKSLINRFTAIFYGLVNYIIIHVKQIHYGDHLIIHGPIFIRGSGEIEIGNNVTINSSLSSNPIGGSTRTVIHCMSGKITIGNNVGMAKVALVCRKSIEIHDGVKIGGGNCNI